MRASRPARSLNMFCWLRLKFRAGVVGGGGLGLYPKNTTCLLLLPLLINGVTVLLLTSIVNPDIAENKCPLNIVSCTINSPWSITFAAFTHPYE